RAHFQTLRQRRIGYVFKVGAHHVIAVANRLVACLYQHTGHVGLTVKGLATEEAGAGVGVVSRDLAKAGFSPRDERRAKALAAPFRLEEAEMLVDTRPVKLHPPGDSAVANKLTIDLGYDHIALSIRVLQVGV